ncbi:MAG: tRNA (guanosine(46)-N7)-methyltransferase TrmB [Bacteroidia bacterium]|nr:tRNA (guanosine(46)-N7)-methyltransferase TrmB [Bacteroidia bacterium]MCX7651271.1 tRNA (guanosine(46)-N7)-methyltransferase TrmB [Bacteroidia bacterium]MDW8416219.1 tRNA (guanosine(46)-N7)-methyltransferase TrmB [Bacteroidia bacterium]
MLGKQEKKRRYFASTYALYGERVPSKGSWRSTLGGSETTPLILEIGCGKGEFAVYLAQLYPDSLIIGLDRRADRLASGCRAAAAASLSNVRFWHGDALTMEAYFGPGEVSTLWFNYPDPYPKRRHEKHRLFHPRFLRIYRTILRAQGELFFRSDSEELYEYALQRLSEDGWKIVFATPELRPGEAPEAAYFPTDFYRRKGEQPPRYIHASSPVPT